MVTSPYEWKILEWNDKPQINKTNQQTKGSYPVHADACSDRSKIGKKRSTKRGCSSDVTMWTPELVGLPRQFGAS